MTKSKSNTKTQRTSAVKPNKAAAPKKAKAVTTTDSDKAAAAVLKKFGSQPVLIKKPLTIPKNGVIAVDVGLYGTETVAKQEAEQFRNKDVFQRRSAIFPLPSSYGVAVEVVSSDVVTAVTKNPLYPYTVSLKLKVTGDDEKVKSWVTALRNRVRGIPV